MSGISPDDNSQLIASLVINHYLTPDWTFGQRVGVGIHEPHSKLACGLSISLVNWTIILSRIIPIDVAAKRDT
jgi:hypothetical protein